MSTNNLFTQTQKMAEEKKRRTFKDQLSSRKFPTLGRNDKSKILEEVLKTSTMEEGMSKEAPGRIVSSSELPILETEQVKKRNKAHIQVDWNAFEPKIQSITELYGKDSSNPLSCFCRPTDDLKLERVPSENRVTLDALEREFKLVSSLSPPFLFEFIKFFIQDSLIVVKRYQQFGNRFKYLATNSSPETISNFDLKRFSTPQEEKKSSTATTPRLSETPSKIETDLLAEKLQQVNQQTFANSLSHKDLDAFREELFRSFPVNDKELNLGVITKPEPLTYQISDFLLRIEDIELKFPFGILEPFFFTVALYNKKSKEKVSEDFHMIPEVTHRFFNQTPFVKRKPLFSLSPGQEFPDIVMVVRIDKLFTNVNEKEHELLYNKGDTENRKELDQLKQTVEELLDGNRLSPLLTPFAISFVQLFDENSKLLGYVRNPVSKDNIRNTTNEETMKIRYFNVQMKLIKPGTVVNGETLYEWLLSETQQKKSRFSCGELSVQIKRVNKDQAHASFDSSLFPLKVFPKDINNNNSNNNSPKNINERKDYVVQEVEEFEISPDADIYPSIHYANILYISLLHLSVKSSSDTSVQVKIQFKRSDNMKALPERCIFQRYSNEFTDVGISNVIYHNKHPDFSDEIKIKLPPDLQMNDHILFTFYNVSIKKGNKILYTIGNAIYRIFENNIISSDGIYTAPVTKMELPNNYLTAPDVKWSKEKKITFKLKVNSTVYPQDKFLNKFFFSYTLNGTCETAIVQKLNSVEPTTCLRFLPVTLNLLFTILGNTEESQARKIFAVLLKLLKKLDNSTSHSLFNSYVTYIYDIKGTKYSIHERICSFWVDLLDNDPGEVLKDFKSNWFLFEVIIKSMVLYLDKEGHLASFQRYRFYSTSFKDNLLRLIPTLMTRLPFEYELIIPFPLFVTQLFDHIEAGLLFKMINSVINNLSHADDVSGAFIKFTWLKILCDYEHYLLLNIPTDAEIDLVSIIDIPSKFWKRHFLAGLLLTEVEYYLEEKGKSREFAIVTLRNLLRKHEFDTRYQNKKIRSLISAIYFPFILTVINHFETIATMSKQEADKFLICCLFILKYSKQRFLKNWWKLDSQRGKIAFLTLLNFCLDRFMDKNRNVEVNFTVLAIILCFVDSLTPSLNKGSSKLMENLFNIIRKMLESQSDLFISCLYTVLGKIVFQVSTALFEDKTPYVKELTQAIIKHCHHANVLVRNKASHFFYLLIKSNYKEKHSVSRTRTSGTQSISQFVADVPNKRNFDLHESFNNVVEKAKNDSDMDNTFVVQVEELIHRLVEITNYDSLIAKNWMDEETVSTIYAKIANDYADNPDLRLIWLENLQVFHVQNGNIEEAVQCKIHVAYLITQYLQKVNPKQLPSHLRTLDSLAFTRISPTITKELPLGENIEESEKEGKFQSGLWNLNSLIKVLKEAVTLLERASQYELSLEIFSILEQIYKHNRNYLAMVEWADTYKTLCSNLVKKAKEGNDIFPRYYRVTFFGKKFFDDSENQKTYIYRKKFKYPIGEVVQSITKQLCSKFNVDKANVIVLPNKKVDVSTLEPDKLYFQIVNVTPYFTPLELEERVTSWEQNFGITQFISELPFMDGKFDEEDVCRIHKRKTIFQVGKALPYITNRIEVISELETILSPIECAIENIQQRCNQFRAEVRSTPYKKNNLQALLMGTVSPTVHSGPTKYCDVFLAPSFNCEPKLKEKLRECIAEMLILCQEAIEINANLIGPEQLHFHEMLEGKFNEFRSMFQDKYQVKKKNNSFLTSSIEISPNT